MENIPYIVNSLSFSEKSDKLRLILDSKHVNMYVYKDKIKFEDWDGMLNYAENENFKFKFDIKRDYQRIDIKPEHKKCLGFA